MMYAQGALAYHQYPDNTMTDVSSGCSDDSLSIQNAIEQTREHFGEPYTRYWNRLDVKFFTLKSRWLSETLYTSSLTDIYLNPSYQKIIGLGSGVLPFIIHDLEKAPNWWFRALESLTDENPVPPEHHGNLEMMAADWIDWARNERLTP